MDSLLVASFGALIGAIFGASAIVMIEWQKHRREIAVELFSEFNTPEILLLRADTELILDTHIRRNGLSDPDSEITLRYLESNISSSDYIKVISVLHMFEKIVVLFEQDRADQKVVKELLGRQARWWYEKYARRFTSEHPETVELLKIVKRLKKISDTKKKLKEYA